MMTLSALAICAPVVAASVQSRSSRPQTTHVWEKVEITLHSRGKYDNPWVNDDKPAALKTADGVVLRAAWGQAGTRSAKTMTDEAGNTAFLFPGKVPGCEKYFPDVERINPAYFQSMDKKIDYLNS